MSNPHPRLAVITGGSSGIGAACVDRFIAEGRAVIVLDRREPQATVAGFHLVDVSDENAVRDAFAAIEKEHGDIDVLINCAGIAMERQELRATTGAHFSRHHEVNTVGVLNCLKFAVIADGGAIVNISSILGVSGGPGYASYVASKYAVEGLTRVAAIEFGDRGIRVNAICPSTVNNPMTATFYVEAGAFAMRSAVDRIVEKDEVAALAAFLGSRQCPSLTGQSFILDAGASAGLSTKEWARSKEACDARA